MKKGGETFLEDLKKNPDCDAKRKALLDLTGVGRKVADCVGLFSLNCPSFIPVDTHVQQIYQ